MSSHISILIPEDLKMEFPLNLFIPFVLWTTATKWRYIFYFACCWNWWPFGLWNSATKWVNFLLCLLLELLMAFLIFCLFVCLSLCVRARVHVRGSSMGLTVLTSNIDINKSFRILWYILTNSTDTSRRLIKNNKYNLHLSWLWVRVISFLRSCQCQI